ncbi:serine/threonine protein kinase [bacterium]|nr:serine/threonine protein kinase [bacterium]
MRVLLLLLLTLWLQAQTQELSIECVPDDAEVWIPEVSSSSLGTVGQGLRFEPGMSSELTLVLRRNGYAELRQKLSLQEAHGKWPRQGSYHLTPLPGLANRGQQLLYWSKKYWGLALVPLIGFVAWQVQRRSRSNGPSRSDRGLRGQQIGPYMIQEFLGAGAMADVYRATRGSQEFAFKVVKEDSPEARKRLLRESKVLQTLDHPNLVRQYDSGEVGSRCYMVLELLRGQNLRELLRVERRGSPERILKLFGPVFQGLAQAHQAGIVHRDLKPDNLLLTESNQLKVLDFGVSRGDGLTVVTRTGLVMGTPQYMAPEQIEGDIDPASDQYALGVILYEVLYGKRPFDGASVMEVIDQQLDLVPKPLGEVAPHLPKPLTTAIDRMLDKDPRNRFRDLNEAWKALSGEPFSP